MNKILSLLCFISITHTTIAQINHQKEIGLIKLYREATNRAIANHDVETLSKYWHDDLVLVRGNSTHLTGKDTIVAVWRKLFQDNPNLYYTRIPTEIIVSMNDSLAWETGNWKASNNEKYRGNYSAMWKKTNNDWKILAELFVSLF